MIRLQPTQGAQTFSIIPSSYDSSVLNSAILRLTENGTNLTEDDVYFTWELSSNGNFVEVSFIDPVPCYTYRATNNTEGTLLFSYLDCDGYRYNVQTIPGTTVRTLSEVLPETSELLELELLEENSIGGVNITLKEGATYTIELYTSTDILYKDLVYVTSQTDKKKVHSINDSYTTVTRPDDEYIIL